MFNFIRRLFFPSIFEIKLQNGVGKLINGNVKKAFIDDCLIICKREKLDSITIYGKSSEYGIRLEFSSSTPESSKQFFRNAWSIYRNR